MLNKKNTMEIKNITLSDQLNISLVLIKNTKFIVIRNSLDTKYICVPSFINIKKENNSLVLINAFDNDELKVSEYNQFVNRLQFGIKNLSTTFKKKLTLKGLGFKINVQENLKNIEFKLGFSHLINLKIPQNIKLRSKKNFIKIEGSDNVLLGNFVNKIISLKSPDSYKGKGFWYKYQKKTLKVVKKK